MGIYRLTKENPARIRLVGVDRSAGEDVYCEAEMEILPDGRLIVLDIRHHEKARHPMKDDGPGTGSPHN